MQLKIKSFEIIQRINNSTWKKYIQDPRIYISFRPNESFNPIDDLIYRRMHEPAKLKPLIIDALKEQHIHATKVKWSRKAGCPCGCSPAFILDRQFFEMFNPENPNEYRNTHFDGYLTYTVEEAS